MKLESAVLAGLALLGSLIQSAAAGDRPPREALICGISQIVHDRACRRWTFDKAHYRAPDPRIGLIKSKGYAGAGLFSPNGEVIVRPSGIADALTKLAPGKQLVIADGVWRDVNVTIVANGTDDQPILVRPQSPGGVKFVGKTQLDVVGSNIVLADLTIRDGRYARSVTALKLGNSERACNHCVAMDLRMQSLATAPGSKLHFLGVRGNDVTVAYSTFAGASSPGHFVFDSQPTENGVPARLHLFHNVFQDRRAVSNENGYELLQLGESTVQAQSMYGRVEQNVFQDSIVPHADTELITVKSSDWMITENTFRNTVGDLTLRSANRVLVERNTFIGGGATSASGVRVHGSGHFIVNNYFYRNANPPPVGFPANSAYYYSVVVAAGTVEDVADGEAGEPVAKNIVIANNTFLDGRYNIHLGSFYPEYPLMPRSVLVTENQVCTDQLQPVFVLPRGSEAQYLCNNAIEGNRLSAANSGLKGFFEQAWNPTQACARAAP